MIIRAFPSLIQFHLTKTLRYLNNLGSPVWVIAFSASVRLRILYSLKVFISPLSNQNEGRKFSLPCYERNIITKNVKVKEKFWDFRRRRIKLPFPLPVPSLNLHALLVRRPCTARFVSLRPESVWPTVWWCRLLPGILPPSRSKTQKVLSCSLSFTCPTLLRYRYPIFLYIKFKKTSD